MQAWLDSQSFRYAEDNASVLDDCCCVTCVTGIYTDVYGNTYNRVSWEGVELDEGMCLELKGSSFQSTNVTLNFEIASGW